MISWRLAQTFWVGGLWVLHLAVLPGMRRMDMAPILVDDIAAVLTPSLVVFAGVGVVLQMVVLLAAERFSSLWRDSRGQVLVISLLMVAGFTSLQQWMPDAERLQLFCFLVLAVCGALLVMQPVPNGEEARARRARH